MIQINYTMWYTFKDIPFTIKPHIKLVIFANGTVSRYMLKSDTNFSLNRASRLYMCAFSDDGVHE